MREEERECTVHNYINKTVSNNAHQLQDHLKCVVQLCGVRGEGWREMREEERECTVHNYINKTASNNAHQLQDHLKCVV